MRIGGQALIEGVLMRSPNYISISTIKKGKIKTKVEYKPSLAHKYKKYLFLRGVISLFEMMIMGTKALIYTSKESEDIKGEIKSWEIALMILLSVGFGIGFFVLIPFYLAKLITSQYLLFNIIDGVLRIVIFVLYILIISRMKDIKRVFQYHGAEHRAISCYESKKKLTVNNCKKFPTEHPRCGTSFIGVVLIISIIIFSIIWAETWYIRLATRILLLPLIAGLSYEILILGDKHRNNFIMKILIAPGIFIQRITTSIPDKKQMEVAIASLDGALKKEKSRKK